MGEEGRNPLRPPFWEKGGKKVLIGEGLVLKDLHPFAWAFNHVGNEDGKILTPGWDNHGKSVTGKVVVYPIVTGSTIGPTSLYYKCKESKHGPVGIICRKVLYDGTLAIFC